MKVAAAGREELLTLLEETYGSAMSDAEFDWWFDRNPASARLLNAAWDDDGTLLGATSMHFARMDHGLGAFAVHVVTSPRARGKGVFSAVELQCEAEAAERGAPWALGFTNPAAGPIYVGKLGWEDVTELRIWVRPKGIRRRGGIRATPLEPRPRDLPAHHIVRDEAYLRWRYAESPRTYAQVEDAIVTHATWHGFSSAIVCEHGRGLERALRQVDAQLAVAMVNPGEERRFLLHGFVPTPRTIRFIGKRIRPDAPPLPKRRDAWHFTLGDLDFF